MKHRSFLGRALAAIAGLLGIAAAPADPEPELRAVHVRRGGKWLRVRMSELHEGDTFRLEGVGVWVATSEPYRTGKTWGIEGRGRADV